MSACVGPRPSEQGAGGSFVYERERAEVVEGRRAARFAGVSIAAALAVAIGAPSPLSAQLEPYVGVSGVWASMPEPYALDTCGKGSNQLFGAGVDVGVRREAFSIDFGYRSGSQRERAVCAIEPPFPLDEGTRIRDLYLRSEREELKLIRSRIGYTPHFAPGLTVYGGAGWETGEWDLALTSGLELSSGNEDIRVSIGVEAVHLRAPFRRSEEVWENFQIVERNVLDEGHRWRTSVGLRAGVKLFVLAWGATGRP